MPFGIVDQGADKIQPVRMCPSLFQSKFNLLLTKRVSRLLGRSRDEFAGSLVTKRPKSQERENILKGRRRNTIVETGQRVLRGNDKG